MCSCISRFADGDRRPEEKIYLLFDSFSQVRRLDHGLRETGWASAICKQLTATRYGRPRSPGEPARKTRRPGFRFTARLEKQGGVGRGGEHPVDRPRLRGVRTLIVRTNSRQSRRCFGFEVLGLLWGMRPSKAARRPLSAHLQRPLTPARWKKRTPSAPQ